MERLSLPRTKKPLKPKVTVAVDLMGSSLEPQGLAEALLEVQRAGNLSCSFLFLAHKSLKGSLSLKEQVFWVPDLFDEKDSPLHGVRRKKNSQTEGLRLVAAGHAQGFISAGDTGTLVTAARLFLKRLSKEIKTTALVTELPSLKNPVMLADVGANVHVKASHFVDFAKLGLACLKARGRKKITMGLLNIGQEATKGPSEWKKAYALLKELKGASFKGNIEPSNLFTGDVDLIITEALAGNILLKTAEGVAKMVMKTIKSSSTQKWLDWSSYPGALLAGLEAPVIKVHGYATEKGFASALLFLMDLLDNRFIEKMKKSLQA